MSRRPPGTRRGPLARLTVAVLAATLLLGLGSAAPAARAAERIRDFDVTVRLAVDGEFRVEERIVYDFGDAERHGIFRDVPVRYGRGLAADYRIALDVESVTDARGEPWPFVRTERGREVRIRIGDPDRTIHGVHEFRIAYRVRRGILWLDDHDELYWNATGNAWPVPIERAQATVRVPANDPGAWGRTCFTGARGSVEAACVTEAGPGWVRFSTRRPLGPNEGLTLVLAVPKGVLREPSAAARAWERVSDWLTSAALLPLAVLLGMGTAWWRLGRDPAGRAAIPVRYAPPEGLTPAEIGTVLDEQVDMRDVTATLLDLAVRGHLEIEELRTTRFLFLSDRDWRLRATGAPAADLKEHERRMLAGLFDGAQEVRLSELKERFYRHLPGIRDALYQEVSRPGGWFPTRPDRVRTIYVALGLVLGVAGASFSVAVLDSGPAALACAASGVIAALFGRAMPRKTPRGRRVQEEILGFREFLQRVEADRLERLGLRDVSHFESWLPHAFVLGAADAWAEAFADLYTEPPRWYHAHDAGGFRARSFVGDLGRTLHTAGETFGSRPSSAGSGSSGFGGGGSSGGGFGGGGGGSW